MAMNPDVKSEWVAALRSGDYKQGIGRLRDNEDKYCCLGVLCEIAVRRHVIPPARLIPDGTYTYASRSFRLPREVALWAGLTESDPKVTDPRSGITIRTIALAELNDSSSVSFATIADVIESEL